MYCGGKREGGVQKKNQSTHWSPTSSSKVERGERRFEKEAVYGALKQEKGEEKDPYRKTPRNKSSSSFHRERVQQVAN